MDQVYLLRQQGFSWSENQGSHFKGYFFSNENYYHSSHADEGIFIEAKDDPIKFKDKINALNGFFSIIIDGDNYILAAVDRLRSIPLFYSFINGHYYLSDDAEWLKNKIANYNIDEISRQEFLLLGYVTGQDTLYQNIKQIQAGNLLVIDKKIKTAKQVSYYDFQRYDFSQDEIDSQTKKLDAVHVDVFRRLVRSLEGRAAVIPLSGGYDSRLIVLMLKRIGYENVICFSYGKQGNWESSTSAKVAEYLGYPWHYINYNLKSWRDWFKSENRKQFYDYSQYHTALPYIQDLLAVNYLTEKKIIPSDAIFIPGHSGDFLAGSHVSYELLDKHCFSSRDLIDAIYKYHYAFWRVPLAKKRQLFDHKFDYLQELDIASSEAMSCAADLWDWQERQAKFIVNSVRAFEFNQYEWRLPLWDNALMNFWQHIPFDQRLQRKLYMEYVSQYQGEINAILALNHHGIEGALLNKPKAGALHQLMAKICSSGDYFYGYFGHRLQIGGTVSLSKYIVNYINGADNAKGILTSLLLNDISSD
jgi:asparagine synthase (glutamine-hydrolysing)